MANLVIVQGEDRTIRVKLKDSVTGDPYPLSGFTSCTGYLPAAAGGGLAVTGTLVSADRGEVDLVLDEVKTALLNVGDDQSMELRVDQGATRTIVQFDSVLDVKAQLF